MALYHISPLKRIEINNLRVVSSAFVRSICDDS